MHSQSWARFATTKYWRKQSKMEPGPYKIHSVLNFFCFFLLGITKHWTLLLFKLSLFLFFRNKKRPWYPVLWVTAIRTMERGTRVGAGCSIRRRLMAASLVHLGFVLDGPIASSIEKTCADEGFCHWKGVAVGRGVMVFPVTLLWPTVLGMWMLAPGLATPAEKSLKLEVSWSRVRCRALSRSPLGL